MSVIGLTPEQIQALTIAQIEALGASDMQALTAWQVAAFTGAQIAVLSGAQVSAMSDAGLSAFTAAQLQSFSLATMSSLTAYAFTGLWRGVSYFTTKQIAALTTAQIAQLSAFAISGLSPTQIAAWTPAQVAAISVIGINGMQIPTASALSVAQVQALSLTQIENLNVSALPIDALSVAQWDGLGEYIGVLPNSVIDLLTTAQILALTQTELQALTWSQLNSLSQAQLRALNVTWLTAGQLDGLKVATLSLFTAAQDASFTDSQVAGLSTAQLVAIGRAPASPSNPGLPVPYTAAQVEAMTLAQIAALTESQLTLFTPALIAVMTPAQVAAISPLALPGLGATSIAALSQPQVQALTDAQIGGLSVPQLGELSSATISDLTLSQETEFSGYQINDVSWPALNFFVGLNPWQGIDFDSMTIGELTVAQFQAAVAPDLWSLTANQAAGINWAQMESLTQAEVSSIGLAAMSGLTATQLNYLDATQIQGLSSDQIAAIADDQLLGLSASFSGLSASFCAALTADQLSTLTPTEIPLLTATELNALTPDALAEIGSSLTAAQLSGLSAATIAAMSVSTFDLLFLPNIASLSPQAMPGMTLAQLATLGDLSNFTLAQVEAMTTPQILAAGSGNAVILDAAARSSGGALSYTAALAVLDDALNTAFVAGAGNPANETVSFDDYVGLYAVADEINSGQLTTSAYVKQMFDNVVDGNTANTLWTGGAGVTVALGNLGVGSSALTLSDLIGKWFLGTDLPNPDVGSVGGTLPVSYVNYSSEALWGTNGPRPGDVDQGASGDCYFLAALAEVALQDPTSIENMISYDGNGTWSVEFQVNGAADYVTVNADLPTLTDASFPTGQTLAFDGGNGALWSPLIEKAYAELNSQTQAPHGGDGVAGNSYYDIQGGDAWSLTELTGQSVTSWQTRNTETAAGLSELLGVLSTAFSQNQDVVMDTGAYTPSGSGLVADHMYAVLSINQAAGTVTLYNPWGVNSDSTNPVILTDSISQLAAGSVEFWTSSGKSVLG